MHTSSIRRHAPAACPATATAHVQLVEQLNCKAQKLLYIVLRHACRQPYETMPSEQARTLRLSGRRQRPQLVEELHCVGRGAEVTQQQRRHRLQRPRRRAALQAAAQQRHLQSLHLCLQSLRGATKGTVCR